MVWRHPEFAYRIKHLLSVRRFYGIPGARPYTVLMLAALIYTLVVKLFHSLRCHLADEYLSWVLADISFLLGIEVILAMICFRWGRTWVVRLVTLVAALVCTWSVMNAGWLIRTGTQILPRVLLPLIRAPVHSFLIVAVNLVEMPIAAIVLLAPGFLTLAFLFAVLAKPKLPGYNHKRFVMRVAFCVMIILMAVVVRPSLAKRRSPQIASVGLRHNAQFRAVLSLVLPEYRGLPDPERKIPRSDELDIALERQCVGYNVVIVILEGIQYRYSSLADGPNNLTPYLATLASEGVNFSNTRSCLTHTTKALFALLTGRFPSASQDLAEAVPSVKPYASIATILGGTLNYRTAFFQSALGSFESRPGLVYNLGFDKFWARDDLDDPNSFLGYLACDEFALLQPVAEWLRAGEGPFFVTILCSVTHDPYEVPDWFGAPAKEPVERYRQAICYTDKFLAALDVELANLHLTERTVLCVVGDHGEAFGEHGQLGHERIAFDEVLRVPFCLRAPFLVEPGLTITDPVSSVDLVPTVLALLSFGTEAAAFDGVNALGLIPERRRVYFAGWMQEGPAGFIEGHRKFIYNPTNKTACVYDLRADPFELDRMELAGPDIERVAKEVSGWRKSSIFQIDQQRTGRMMLFDRWLCRWSSRVSSAKYQRARR